MKSSHLSSGNESKLVKEPKKVVKRGEVSNSKINPGTRQGDYTRLGQGNTDSLGRG